MNTIFVIVKVSYDYYRFQENLGATASLEEARLIASTNASRPNSKHSLRVVECRLESEEMDTPEICHILIEQWPKP